MKALACVEFSTQVYEADTLNSVITRASFFNKVNFMVVSLNDVLFCKNSRYKE